MKIINKLNRYLEEEKYRITIKDNKINILNYDEIIDFSSNRIIIRCKDNIITIDGKRLIILKMIDDEVLIDGMIFNIRIN